MKPSLTSIRIAGSFATAAASALFVFFYNLMKLNNAVFEGIALPHPTHFYSVVAPYGLLLPFAIAGLLFFAKDRHPRLFTAAKEFALVFSIAWSLGAVLAWDLPYALTCCIIE